MCEREGSASQLTDFDAASRAEPLFLAPLLGAAFGVEDAAGGGGGFRLVLSPASASLTDLAAELAGKIGKVVNEKGATLVAKAETREERIERLVKSLKDGKRPSVSIKISERHFGGPVIDPAAETELGYILKKAGFTLVDDKSSEKPDIEITGEAFSAFGLRKGNLISCRSRIELKVQERRDGKILAVDRQTSVAVDIAEQAAAKSALQNAADEVAERILPKLVQ